MTLRVSAELERGINSLTEIYRQMRWLELSQASTPLDRDVRDYEMLVKDMAATLERLLHDLADPGAINGDPTILAASDFPLSASDAMTAQASASHGPSHGARRTERPTRPAT